MPIPEESRTSQESLHLSSEINSFVRENTLLSDPAPGLRDFLRKKAGLEGVQRMDIQKMDVDDWLRLDDAREKQLQLKEMLLQECPDLVVRALPESAESCHELLMMISQYLADYHADQFTFDGQILIDKASGRKHPVSSLRARSALHEIGKILQEDFLIITPTESGTHKLIAGAVFFPSSWSLSNRIGQELPTIHGDVPTLNENIGNHIDRFLGRLKPGASWERSSFLLYNTDELALIPGLSSYVADPKSIDQPETLFLRTERETFTRLPQTGDIAFSFRTYIDALPKLPVDVRFLLADILEKAPSQYIRDYKGIQDHSLRGLLGYLRR